MNVQLGEGAFNAKPAQTQKKLPVELALCRIDILFGHRRSKAKHNGGAVQGLDAKIAGSFRNQVRIFCGNCFQQFGKLLFQRFQIRLVGNSDVTDRVGSLVGAIENVLHFRIIDDFYIAAAINDAGGANADFLNCAPKSADLYDVANIALVFKQHENAGDYVRNEAFRAKANDQS